MLDTNGTEAAAPAPAAKGKKKTVESTYQKKTQLEHILLRPDSYIGSVEKVSELMWVLDKENNKIIQKEVTYVPGLYKIFDEILVNAADNKQRDPKMDTIKIDIDPEANLISVYNNGAGIPVVMHKEQNMYVPTMIFGHLLTSSNYDDDEKKVTGGRNGYGAKLCNIFSTKFTVETVSKEYKRTFKQTWGANMSKASEPKVKDSAGTEFTKITFSPDLTKFKMDVLDDDLVALLSRRAYDIAASSKGVKVFLNGTRVPVKNFKEYIEFYIKDRTDDTGNALKVVHEVCSDRWEVALTLSDKGYQHVSFVNSISTPKGGRHVDYITNMAMNSLAETINKKNKSGVQIKPFQIKNSMWVFVNCLIENPTFDSQTKDTMTLMQKSFGSKCSLSPKFCADAVKNSGIIDAVLSFAKFKAQAALQRKCDGKKTNKIKGVPKLEDANDAGGRNSNDCTLILTEGDSAKTLAVAGLGVVGRDRYGVFPLRGKLLNTREATTKQIMENAEINNIIKIIGLQYKKKYTCAEDLKSLRYGKMMIMTDQDHDGSHIKGLLINFIHHNWPSLLQIPFLEEFITPIVKATKNKDEQSFYSLPEFEEWKAARENWHTYKIKYYKGLGTSTSKEAKEYFSDMLRHRILFKYDGSQDDFSINMAFNKKSVDQRKEWLTSFMVEGKRRKELGLPEVYLYEKNTRAVNYSDFINKELVLFSNADNERSIPCLVDGLKPGQRKVLFTCLKRNDKKEVKVAQLAGSIAEHTAYHHGEVSLMSTIINLAQNHVGSNNINLLQPIGQFGTRLMGGKDSASPRYIFTKLSPLARAIFHPQDDPLLNFLKEDNQKIEPQWYMPVIPMVLVNGAEGIGTGWSTKIPNYNPRQIIDNMKLLVNGEEPKEMIPFYKNFRGVIEPLDSSHYMTHGEVAELDDNRYEITELPIKTWTQAYKENTMEVLLGGEKTPQVLSDYKEYNTDTTIRFVVSVVDGKVNEVRKEGPHKMFKLQSSLATTSMVLFDHLGCLRKFNNVDEILQEFYTLRIEYYDKRRKYLVGMLQAEANKLSNQARFIKEKCDGKLVIENKKKKLMIEELVTKGYESDPIKAWKKAIERSANDYESDSEFESEEGAEEVEQGKDFDYLLGMPMWNLTKEKKDAILKQEQEKIHDLEVVKKKTPKDMYITDLDDLLALLDKVEEEERLDELNAGKKLANKASAKAAAGGKRKKIALAEVAPSPQGVRVAPSIDPEMRRKRETANARKTAPKRVKKEIKEEADEFDDILKQSTGSSLASKIGNSPDKIAKAKRKSKDGMKQTKLAFSSTGRKKSGWQSDSDNAGGSDMESDVEEVVAPRERATGRRAAAAKAKFTYSSEEDGPQSDSDVSLHSNEGIEEGDNQGPLAMEDSVVGEKSPPPKKKAPKVELIDSDSDNSPPPSKKKAPVKAELIDSDSDASPIKKKSAPKPSAPKPKFLDSDSEDDFVPPKKESNADMFDSLLSDSSPVKPSNAQKRVVSLDSSDEDAAPPPKKKAPAKKAAAPKKAAPKKTTPPKKSKAKGSDSDNSMDFDMSPAPLAARATTGRSRKAVAYVASSEEDSDY